MPHLDGDGDGQPSSLTSLLGSIFAQAASPPAPPTASAPGQGEQDPALRLLATIQSASSLADSLALFSDNDALQDLSTSTLRVLFLHSVWAEVQANVRTVGDLQARKRCLEASKIHYAAFIKLLFDLAILPKPSHTDGPTPIANASPTFLLSSLLRPFADPRSGPSAAAASLPSNPSHRRELKVALFKLERALKSALDEYRHAVREKASVSRGGGLSRPGAGTSTGAASTAAAEAPDDAQWDLLILPRGRSRGRGDTGGGDEDEDEDDEDTFVSGSGSGSTSTGPTGITPPTTLRSYLLLLLQLHALLSYNALASIQDELQLLSNIPASAERDAAERQAREDAEEERRRRGGGSGAGGDSDDFRIERRFDAAAPGPLMDDKGKPLRPFTITSGAGAGAGRAGAGAGASAAGPSLPVHDLSERERLRASVFQPSHRLPTMSIDEYLAEEERRGNILRGGGPEGAAQPTPRESRAVRAQMDGSREAEDALEEERQEAVYWDAFREENKKGAGNTMNRG